MINVFEALKSDGLIYQDPTDPSGSTWTMNPDAMKVVEKVEKLVEHSWKVGRRYQLGELTTNKRLSSKNIDNPYDPLSRGKQIGYNQAIEDFEKIFEAEEEGIIW